MFTDLRMADRPSLTAQLEWAVEQAEKRANSAAAVSTAALRHSFQSAVVFDAQEERYQQGFWTATLPHHVAAAADSSWCPSSVGGGYGGGPVSSAASDSVENTSWYHSQQCVDYWGPNGSCDFDETCGRAAGTSHGVLLRQQQGSSTTSASSAYLEDLLSEWVGDHGQELLLPMDDRGLVAYQVIHTELADMIGPVSSSQLEPWPAFPATPANPDVEACQWVESLTTASAPSCLSSFPSFASASSSSTPAGTEEDCGHGGDSEAASSSSPDWEDKTTLEEVTDMLVECGEAVVAQDLALATDLFSRIRRHFARPDGTALQRLCNYFLGALMAKLSGTGASLYLGLMSRDKPALAEAERVYLANDPTTAVAHELCITVLLDAFAGAAAVHIVDYGGVLCWQGLVRALAARPEGPPRLRITGIHFSYGPGPTPPGGQPTAAGHKLALLASALGVPFEFRGFTCKWEDVEVGQLGLRDDEVLAVTSLFRLRHLPDADASAAAPSDRDGPRKIVLERICSMRPKVFIMADRSQAANSPCMVSRLKESVPSWYSFFDFLDTIMPRESVPRLVMEHECFGYRILNTIACEGADRRERPEAYYQWHWRLVNAGFQQVPLAEKLLLDAKRTMEGFHRDWTLGHDHGWLLTGWKSRIHHAFSVWTPAATS